MDIPLGKDSIIQPSSIMLRKECIEKVGYYREEFWNSQDYDLWLRIAEQYKVANIPEPLYKWRVMEISSISMNKFQIQTDFTKLIQLLAWERRIYGRDRLQIPEKRQQVIDYIKSLQEKNATRHARSEKYLYWSRFFRIYDINTSLKFLIKSFFLDPFYCLSALFALGIKKIFEKTS